MRATPTKLQMDVLQFITAFMDREGYSPSYSEILEGIGSKNRGGLHGVILRLEQRGLIRRQTAKKRAIEVVNPIEHHLREVLIQCNLSDATRAELMALRVAA